MNGVTQGNSIVVLFFERLITFKMPTYLTNSLFMNYLKKNISTVIELVNIYLHGITHKKKRLQFLEKAKRSKNQYEITKTVEPISIMELTVNRLTLALFGLT